MNKFHHEDLNKYIGSYDVNKYIGSSISKKEDKKNYRKMKV